MNTAREVYALLLWHPTLALLPFVASMIGTLLVCVFEQRLGSWLYGFLSFAVVVCGLLLAYAGLTGIITALGGGVFAGPLAMFAALLTIAQIGIAALIASGFYNIFARHREWEMMERKLAENRLDRCIYE